MYSLQSTLVFLACLSLSSCAITSACRRDFSRNSCPKLSLYPSAETNCQCYYNSDVFASVFEFFKPEMVKRNGFDLETTFLTTEDKYISTLFHVTDRNAISQNSTPVLIIHGLAKSADVWVDKKERSLAFYLAERGYDVYLGNIRGSTYSNKHETLSKNGRKYWEYNLDTIAKYDIGRLVRYVFEKSNGKKLVYIGQSEGTAVSFMYTSAYHEDAQRMIRGVVALAPVAYLNGSPLMKSVLEMGLSAVDLIDTLGMKGLLYQERTIHTFVVNFCKFNPQMCLEGLYAGFGRSEQFLIDDLLLLFGHFPAGMSVYQIKHFFQIAESAKFQKYDHGLAANRRIYGTDTPPSYNLSDIKVPYCLFYGEKDSFYTPTNLEKVYNELGSSKKLKYSVVNDKGQKFNHIDFIYSKYINEVLHDKVVNVIESDFTKI